ncbi:hypothetical protein IV203_025066 [Nitzschia inconspicua]|uniref:Uncharacterized protein n=1 Tax=Nitzschia inconspicua TaxID=303405 RepID=A0A9K3LPC3_9STRA|nr:hypothetical protein IV203_025187 [Nitzschia inconspicua]KAG7365625.1 hypothetical protein IV203_025066 [Nitzschia inconspicua]
MHLVRNSSPSNNARISWRGGSFQKTVKMRSQQQQRGDSTTSVVSSSSLSLSSMDEPHNNNRKDVVTKSILKRSTTSLGTNNSSCCRKNHNNKNVSFSTIEIRDYPMTIGDNPAVSRGVPITIEWAFTSVKTIPVSVLDPTFPHRREDSLVLSSLERARILKDLGYSKLELKEAVCRTDRDRQKRQETTLQYFREQQQQQQQRQQSVGLWDKLFNFIPQQRNESTSTTVR